MKPETEEPRVEDRISTRQELGEVIVQLLEQRQLSYEPTLESLQALQSRTLEVSEVWTDLYGNGERGTEIEPLTNIILGRGLPCN